MFSGLGNLDINSTFGSFSNAFSLDNLQSTEKDEESIEKVVENHLNGNNTKEDVGVINYGEERYHNDIQLAQEIMELRALLNEKETQINEISRQFEDNSVVLESQKSRIEQLTSKFQTSGEAERQLQTKLLQTEKTYKDQLANLEQQLNEEVENRVSSVQDMVDKYNLLLEDYKSLQTQQQQLSHANSVHSDSGATSGDENVQKLANEIKSLDLALSQAKNKTESVEKQLEKCRTKLRDTKAKLHDSELRCNQLSSDFSQLEQSSATTEQQLRAAVEMTEKKLQTLIAECESDRAQSSELQSALAESRRDVSALQVAAAALQQTITTLDSSSVQQVAFIDSLRSEVTELKTLVAAKSAEILTVTSANASLSSEVAALRNGQTSSLEENVVKLQQKEAQCLESEAKVASLTEKLREVMQRLLESKKLLTAAEQAHEHKVAEMSKITAGKESEVTSLRLKLENIEQHTSDHRLKTSELAERFGEAQREITRSHDLVKEHSLTIEALQAETASLSGTVSSLLEEKDGLLRQLSDAQQRQTESEEAHRGEVERLGAQLVAVENEHKAHIAEYQLELSSVQNRLRNDTESADVLDGYKKRAQVALKKANASAAVLTQENAQLRTQLEENNLRVSEMELALQHREEQEALVESRALTLEAELASVRQQLQQVSAEKEALVCAKVTDNSADNEYKELYAKSLRLEATIAELHAQSAGHVATISELRSSQKSGLRTDLHLDLKAATETTHQSNGNNDSGVFSDVSLHEPQIDPAPRAETSWARSAARPSPSSDNLDSFSNSSAVDTFSISATSGAPSSGLLLVSELHNQLDALKRELSQRGIDIEAAHQQLQAEREEKKKLKHRIEELLAFLDRTKKLQQGPDSATNMEYLKNCVVKYMASGESSERRRLFPVIATILKLTQQEKDQVALALRAGAEAEQEVSTAFGAIGSIAESFWGYSASAILGSTTATSNSSSSSNAGMPRANSSNSSLHKLNGSGSGLSSGNK